MADTEIWLSETEQGCAVPVPNTVFVFDEEVNASWWKWTGFAATRMISLDATNDSHEFLAGGTDGTILRLEDPDALSDLGTNVTGRWTTKWLDQGQPDTVKIYRSLYIETDRLGAPLDVTWSTDDGKATGGFTARYRGQYVWGTATDSKWRWNDSTGAEPFGAFYNDAVTENLAFSLPQSAIGRRIQFTISESGGLTPFRILGMQLYYRVRRQRYAQEVK